MPAPKDITGQKFYNLTAIKKVAPRNKHTYWLFRCDCGVEKEINKADVVHNKQKTCGCGLHQRRDIIGQKFNKLTALKYSRTIKGSNWTKPLWWFKCDCGVVKEMCKSMVVRHYTKSCGCLVVETAKTNVINLLAATGKSFTTDEEKQQRCLAKTAQSMGRVLELFTKEDIIRRDGNHCFVCKTNNARLMLSYIKPLKGGGFHCLSNVKLLCRRCVGRKKSRTLDEFLKEINAKTKKCLKCERTLLLADIVIDGRFNTYKAECKQCRRLQVAQRRRNKRGTNGFFTLEQWRLKIQYYGNCCYLCRASLENKIIHQEHRIPLSRGGNNWLANISPACESCNHRKHTLTEKEFRESTYFKTLMESKNLVESLNKC